MPREMLKTLNTKELAVYSAFPAPKDGAQYGTEMEIEELAALAFPKKGSSPATKGNSWVRNSLRKLLKLGFIKYEGRRSGTYCRIAGSPEPASVARPAVAKAPAPAKKVPPKKKAA